MAQVRQGQHLSYPLGYSPLHNELWCECDSFYLNWGIYLNDQSKRIASGPRRQSGTNCRALPAVSRQTPMKLEAKKLLFGVITDDVNSNSPTRFFWIFVRRSSYNFHNLML
jgi:hypothetical protein